MFARQVQRCPGCSYGHKIRLFMEYPVSASGRCFASFPGLCVDSILELERATKNVESERIPTVMLLEHKVSSKAYSQHFLECLLGCLSSLAQGQNCSKERCKKSVPRSSPEAHFLGQRVLQNTSWNATLICIKPSIPCLKLARKTRRTLLQPLFDYFTNP